MANAKNVVTFGIGATPGSLLYFILTGLGVEPLSAPTSRTYPIPAEARAFPVDSEARTLPIPSEPRVYPVR